MKNLNSIEIPLAIAEKAARWEMQADLSGKRYGFYISYNTRQDAWFMSIMDANGELLLAGIRLVCGVDFLKKYRASVPELPPGDLSLTDREGRNNADPTRDDLHLRYALVYTTVEG